MLAQVAVQDRGVETCAESDGERQAGMMQFQPEHKQQVHHLRGEQRGDANFHRGSDILPCVKSGGEDFHQDHPDQPDAVAEQRLARHQHIVCGKCAMLEEGRQQRHGDHAQGQRGGQRQHDRQAQSPIQQLRVFRKVVIGMAFGK